jgi:serine/threonine-protein kinase
LSNQPANILVEQAQDGRLRPVVMDFGIAREGKESSGLTEAGMVMGTPNYMAPEQAAGLVEQIDRRSDVYSLGATLYELLTGRPPIVGETVVDVLFKVLQEDPVPPRQLQRSVPVDLETIALKCLAKEQSLRYDSAKALAEDLQRYVNGEPIVARKASLAYRLGKQIRKQKSLFALSLLSLLFISALVTDRLRVHFQHARQAKIVKAQIERARLLGQDAKETEWFMRAVYELPMHDVTREQEIMRSRMRQLEEQIDSLGREGGQLAHYALGRGYMALQSSDLALHHLQKAMELGKATPELHYALGRLMGERFLETLRGERRRGDVEWLRARKRKLEQEFLQPAMEHLAQSRGVKLESAELVDGLLALYQARYEKANAHADAALASAPWLYEAYKLKGDVWQARALAQYIGGATEKAAADLVLAIAEYDQAAERGRSDISVLEARAEAWGHLLQQLYETHRPFEDMIPKAQSACQQAITVAPKNDVGYRELAGIHLLVAQSLFDNGKDPRPHVKELTDVAKAGLRNGRGDPGLENAMGDGLLLVLFYEDGRGLPLSVDVNEAIDHQRRAIALNPSYLWAYNGMAGLYLFRSERAQKQNTDPREDLQTAIRYSKEAVRLSPNYGTAYSNLTYFYMRLASYQLEHKQGIDDAIAAGIAYGQECQRRKPKLSDCAANLALLHLTRARSLSTQPQMDAEFLAAVKETLAQLDSAEQKGDSSLELHQSRARVQLLYAQHQIHHSQSADTACSRAKKSLDACFSLVADDAQCKIIERELGILCGKQNLGKTKP